MIINTNHKISKPAHGETREITRFAWLPVFIGTKLVWLSRYKVLQGYYYAQYIAIVNGEQKGFNVGRWVDLSVGIETK